MSFASLPYELLVRICGLNAPQSHHAHVLGESIQHTMAASQVCRHWRSIVLSAPELWRFSFDPYHPSASWRELLLKRSEPLSIEFNDIYFMSGQGRHPHDIVRLQMLSGTHLRLRRYKLDLRRTAETLPIYNSLWPSYPGSWPQLQYLSLTIESKLSRPPHRLPDHFPGLATPVLEHLSLASFYMPDWDELRTIGTTLTHLVIDNPGLRLCPGRWIGIFESLPHLKDLHIFRALEISCDHQHTNSRFTLEVESLGLEDSPLSCNSFLDRIELSSKCSGHGIIFHRHPQSEFEHEISEDSLKAVLSQFERMSSHTVADNLKLTLCDSMFIIESGPLEPAYFSPHKSIPVVTEYSHCLTLSLGEDGVHELSFFLPAIVGLILRLNSSVDIIEIGYTHAISEENANILFEFMVRCENLRFMLNMDRGLWERLHKHVMSTTAGVAGNVNPPLFPKLRLIGLGYGIHVEDAPACADWISFEDMRAFCRHTDSLKVPLERICFCESGIFEVHSLGEVKLKPESGGRKW